MDRLFFFNPRKGGAACFYGTNENGNKKKGDIRF